ncbi:MAG: lipopolysaccharide heptosyltransferase II [Planctomycetota bacterium]
MRTGVFLPNWIGDVVMATPALRALRHQADAAGDQLIGVMKPYVADVLEGLNWLDESLLTRKSAPGQPSLAQQLRQLQLDRVVLLTNSFRSGWRAWQSGAPERIGVARDWRGPLLTTKLFEPRKNGRRLAVPPVDSYLNTAYAAGAEWQPPTLELATTDADEQGADAVWDHFNLPAGDRVVVLNSGGAFGAAKSWPAEHFAGLAGRLAAEGWHVLVNCGPAERDIARQIAADSGSAQVVSLADWPTADAWQVPIGLSKAVIRRARLLVTTDSGPRFFGLAFGKPVVSLFGPMGFHATRTHSPLETPLSLNLDCSPCHKPVCPLKHHRCMRDLSVDRVFAAVQQQLGASDAERLPSADAA